MNDPIVRLSLGIAMGIVGLILILIAGRWGYDAYRRWGAVNALEDGRRLEFIGRERAAIDRFQRAARYDRHPSTALAALNPAHEQASAQAHAIARGLRQQAQLGRLAVEYIDVFQGNAGSITSPGVNGELLRLITLYREHSGGSVPPLPNLGPRDLVDPALWRLALEWRLRAAWTAGDQATLRQAAGQFALLYPNHPATPFARILHAGASETHREQIISRLVAATRSSPETTASVLRAAGRLNPGNNASLQALIPSQQRTGAELIATMIKAKAPAGDIVREAIRLRNNNILRTVASYCISIERFDLLRELSRHGDEEFQRMTAILLARRELDLVALRRLQVDDSSVRPRAMLLHNTENALSFHLCDAHGQVPVAPVTIRLDDTVVPPASIQRLGSLHRIPATRRGRQNLELRMGDVVFFNQEVIR
ncbi:MAG: hypothetical protein EA402_14255 [Planctomycetota bacterium]|nr:MAG: hypothetical protein EA402_14255 [Planctomycetota bacterium]